MCLYPYVKLARPIHYFGILNIHYPGALGCQVVTIKYPETLKTLFLKMDIGCILERVQNVVCSYDFLQ